MNEQALLRYLAEHQGTALIGNSETLISAIKLEKSGKVYFIGREGGNYRYGLTAQGGATIRSPNRVRVVKAAKVVGGAVQSYATAFKDEQRARRPAVVRVAPVPAPPAPPQRLQRQASDAGYLTGLEGVGGEGYFGINPSDYPGLQYAARQQAPMGPAPAPAPARRRVQPKRAPMKKGSGFIIVNGKKYRRVG